MGNCRGVNTCVWISKQFVWKVNYRLSLFSEKKIIFVFFMSAIHKSHVPKFSQAMFYFGKSSHGVFLLVESSGQ